MRIAQAAPLYESVPPKLYGGTERIVSYLTEELVSQGHEVTLFASGDSVTRARLVAACERSLRLDEQSIDRLAHHIVMLEQLFQRISDFDFIHFHIDYLHFPLSRCHHVPHVTTLHGRLDIPDLVNLYNEFREMPVVSISNSQRLPLPQANWIATVYHGLPLDLYSYNESCGDYLIFLGRLSPEKRPDRAIEIALKAGVNLKIAAKVDEVNVNYFESIIKPLLNNSPVEFLGEINDKEKDELLRNATGLLFPIDWPEPFGMVMIEAMASGTPVIAYPCGAVPEIIENGKTGFVVDSIDDAVKAVKNLCALDRKKCRQEFEERFSAGRMTHDYIQVYQKLMENA